MALTFVDSAPTSVRASEMLSVSDVPSFCATVCGCPFLRESVHLGDVTLELYLYPNGLASVHDGLVQFVVELTALPPRTTVVLSLELQCIETQTQYKATKRFAATGDSDGMLCSLPSTSCRRFKCLRFAYDISVLQTVDHDGAVTDCGPRFEPERVTEFKWRWSELRHVLHKIKFARRETLHFSDAVGASDMFCFCVASKLDQNKGRHVSISAKLLRLPLGVSAVTVLFRARLGYPEYSNTFTLDYDAAVATLTLVGDDVDWLLDTAEHQHCIDLCLSIVIRQLTHRPRAPQISCMSPLPEPDVSPSKTTDFRWCWLALNGSLDAYYKDLGAPPLQGKFLRFVEEHRLNDFLICVVVGSDERWDVLHFDDAFPVAEQLELASWSLMTQLVSFVLRHLHRNAQPPNTADMRQALLLMREKDEASAQRAREDACLDAEEQCIAQEERRLQSAMRALSQRKERLRARRETQEQERRERLEAERETQKRCVARMRKQMHEQRAIMRKMHGELIQALEIKDERRRQRMAARDIAERVAKDSINLIIAEAVKQVTQEMAVQQLQLQSTHAVMVDEAMESSSVDRVFTASSFASEPSAESESEDDLVKLVIEEDEKRQVERAMARIVESMVDEAVLTTAMSSPAIRNISNQKFATEVDAFYANMRRTKLQPGHQSLLRFIRATTNDVYDIHHHGGSVWGTDTVDSHPNVCLDDIHAQYLPNQQEKLALLRKIAEKVQRVSGVCVVGIDFLNAHYPSITIRNSECGSTLNVSILDDDCHYTLVLIHALIHIFTARGYPVRELIVFVKHWSKQRGINDASKHYLNSLCYTLMVIKYMQCVEFTALNVGKEVSSLIHGFFYFYGHLFDHEHHSISIVNHDYHCGCFGAKQADCALEILGTLRDANIAAHVCSFQWSHTVSELQNACLVYCSLSSSMFTSLTSSPAPISIRPYASPSKDVEGEEYDAFAEPGDYRDIIHFWTPLLLNWSALDEDLTAELKLDEGPLEHMRKVHDVALEANQVCMARHGRTMSESEMKRQIGMHAFQILSKCRAWAHATIANKGADSQGESDVESDGYVEISVLHPPPPPPSLQPRRYARYTGRGTDRRVPRLQRVYKGTDQYDYVDGSSSSCDVDLCPSEEQTYVCWNFCHRRHEEPSTLPTSSCFVDAYDDLEVLSIAAQGQYRKLLQLEQFSIVQRELRYRVSREQVQPEHLPMINAEIDLLTKVDAHYRDSLQISRAFCKIHGELQRVDIKSRLVDLESQDLSGRAEREAAGCNVRDHNQSHLAELEKQTAFEECCSEFVICSLPCGQHDIEQYLLDELVQLEHALSRLIQHHAQKVQSKLRQLKRLQRTLQYQRAHRAFEAWKHAHSQHLYRGVEELTHHDAFVVDDVPSFVQSESLTRFGKHKISIGGLELRVYLSPNGTVQDNAGFVQLYAKLTQIPKEMHSAVVYFNFQCPDADAGCQITKRFYSKSIADASAFAVWPAACLPLHQCRKYTSMRFEYQIDVLQTILFDLHNHGPGITTDHARADVIKRNVFNFALTKRMISRIRYFKSTNRFSENVGDAFAYSVESDGPRSISLCLRLLKLPPMIEGYTVTFLWSMTLKKKRVLGDERCVLLDYNQTQCRVRLTTEQCERIVSSQHLHIQFDLYIDEVLVRGDQRPFLVHHDDSRNYKHKKKQSKHTDDEKRPSFGTGTAVNMNRSKQCGFCNARYLRLKVCSRCKAASYCSRKHQKKHWPAHKTSCFPS